MGNRLWLSKRMIKEEMDSLTDSDAVSNVYVLDFSTLHLDPLNDLGFQRFQYGHFYIDRYSK